MQEHGLRWHFMREIEERGAEAVIADAIDEALDGPDSIYLSLDIDVIDPGMAPGTGTPEPGGMLTREVLRAIRQIVGAVDLAGMDIVEVSPPYDQAETTAMVANRAALEAISALARQASPTAGSRPLGGLSHRRRRRSIAPIAATAAALARLYDLDLVDDPGDLDLYLALADRTGGPILELAVGTGRLAVPLAEAGHEVTGVDLDPAMLERARATRATRGRRRGPPDPRRGRPRRAAPARCRRFGLAFIALNSLLVLPTRAAQRAALAALADHLAPGGLAVVDIWLPDAEDLARFDGRIILEWPRLDPETGAIVTKAGSAQHDAATAIVALTTIFEEGGQGEPARRWIRRDRLRLVSADELRGVRRGRRARRRDARRRLRLGPLGPGSERAILIAGQALTSAPSGHPAGPGPPGGVPPATLVVSSGRWHRATRRACSSSRTSPRSRSTSAACSTPRRGQAARRPDRRQQGRRRRSAAPPGRRPRRRAAPGPDQGPQARRADPRGRARRAGHRPDRAAEPGRARPGARASTACWRCRSRAST